jgi:hypothetical protein
MLALFFENCRYVFRSRMVFLILIFSSMVHYAGLKSLTHLTLSIQGQISVLGNKETLYLALILQLFTGLSIACVYGIWMAPYAHRGERGVLTHVLPVEKIKFPICYAFCCGLLLFINELVMIGTFALVFGLSNLSSAEFAWSMVLKMFLFQTLCLEVLMLGLAVSSLVFGQVATFFIGGSMLFVVQVLGALARFFQQSQQFSPFSAGGIMVAIYQNLPPVGDFVFDFKKILSREAISSHHLSLWFLWLILFTLLFWRKIRFPSQTRSTEA